MSDQPQPTTQKGNILLVDDDKFLLDMYALKFTHEGYTVHGCLSVADGLDCLAKGFAADAVVFDIIMPDADGFAFLEALKSQKLGESAIKIALTNQSNESDQAHARELGADLCLVKASMIPSEVVNMVGGEIAKRKRS
jgi:DNA-binding response OmpR family regulator